MTDDNPASPNPEDNAAPGDQPEQPQSLSDTEADLEQVLSSLEPQAEERLDLSDRPHRESAEGDG